MIKRKCIAWLKDMIDQFTRMNVQEIAVTKEIIEVEIEGGE